MKRICWILIVGLVSLSNSSPALAAGQPLFFGPFYYELTSVLADCGTFQVLVASEVELKVTVFFDADGDDDRYVLHFSGTDTYINSVTGKSFSDTFYHVDFEDVEPPTLTEVGVVYRLTVPGGGAVMVDIGRIAIQLEPPFDVIFEAGHHQWAGWTGVGDYTKLCAAMA